MRLYTEREIIEMRDNMSVLELRKITNQAKKDFGYVDFRAIFKTMGFEHAFGDKWKKI